jgi:hypothetical protein
MQIGLIYTLMVVCRPCSGAFHSEFIPEPEFSSNNDAKFSVLADTYPYNGAAQQFTVPAGATGMTVTLYGASGDMFSMMQGDGITYTGSGGSGAVIQATIPVSAGQTYYLYVGGAGTGQSGGFNGGGSSSGTTYGMGGGGATDLRSAPYGLADRIMVAGGGGGASGDCTSSPTPGGNAGYPTGVDAAVCSSYFGGGGGTSSGGGSATDSLWALCRTGDRSGTEGPPALPAGAATEAAEAVATTAAAAHMVLRVEGDRATRRIASATRAVGPATVKQQ